MAFNEDIVLDEDDFVLHPFIDDDDFSDHPFADNPDDRCPFELIADTSGSMNANNNIGKLNQAIKTFFSDLDNDPLAKRRIDLNIIGCGGDRPTELLPMKTVQDIQPSDWSAMQASGGTPMDQSVIMALDNLERRKVELRRNRIQYYRPLIIVLTDGGFRLSPDTVKRLNDGEAANGHRLFPIGIGENARKESLALLSAITPPMKIEEDGFAELFLFLSSSLKDISKQQPGNSYQAEIPKCLTLM